MSNPEHFHLLVNHFPIIVPIVGLLVLIYGYIRKNDTIKNTAYGIFIFAAIMTPFAGFSGEKAAEAVDGVSGFDPERIHHHAEMASRLGYGVYLLAILSGVTLYAYSKKKDYLKYVEWATAACAMITVLFFAPKAGSTGGEIRHTEIRSAEDNAQPTGVIEEGMPSESIGPIEDDDSDGSMKAGYEGNEKEEKVHDE